MGIGKFVNWVALVSIVLLPVSHAMAAEIRIAAVGDSLTAGYGLPREETFPVRLEQALRRDGIDVSIINAGVSGDTSMGALARLRWVLGDNPDAVIIALGGNDALRGLNPDLTMANLDTIVTTLSTEGVAVLLAGMKAPPNMGVEYGYRFNYIFPSLAKQHRIPFYPFFLEGVAANRSLNQNDGIHPNAAGINVIVQGILPKVKELIRGLRRRKK